MTHIEGFPVLDIECDVVTRKRAEIEFNAMMETERFVGDRNSRVGGRSSRDGG